jgi:hypothetical protein
MGLRRPGADAGELRHTPAGDRVRRIVVTVGFLVVDEEHDGH